MAAEQILPEPKAWRHVSQLRATTVSIFDGQAALLR